MGETIKDHMPHLMTPVEVHAELLSLKKNGGDAFEGYGEQHAWIDISGLWRLSYMKSILLPHNIDAMHTEKNIGEACFVTIMGLPDKTRDNVKSRVDQELLCDRHKLDMVPPRAGKKLWTKPKADFALTRQQRREVLEWFQTLKFPDGFAANWRRGVNLDTMRISGLKSHDYHIWLELLQPVMVRGYVPETVWRVLEDAPKSPL